jgi:hypothetical protein
MKIVLLFLFVAGCAVQDCRIDPNATRQDRSPIKTDTKSLENKSESKSIVEQVRDLRERLQPGAQFTCRF